MKWLTNIYDPKRKNARRDFNKRHFNIGDFEWEQHMKWVQQNKIGRPQASKYYSVEQLESMGLVGMYSTTEE